MTDQPSTSDYLRLFLQDVPMMDVRAPVEFAQGAFPSAVNRPLLDDEQRAAVGLRYKEQGQDAAITLGLALATDEMRADRYQGWQQFAQEHPDGVLYCFRGGLRSRTSQSWMQEFLDIRMPLVTGGYKAMRQFLISSLETQAPQSSFLLLSGYTGSGKTSLLAQMSDVIDLEEFAKHRGSAFGERVCGQPSQIDFEHQLSIALLKQRSAAPNGSVWLEDEGDFIGSVAIPKCLRQAMKLSPMVVLDCSLEERVDHTFDEYVRKLHLDFCAQFGAEGDRRYADFMRERLARIQRRLGGTRYQALLAQLEQGLLDWIEQRGEDTFRGWLGAMLQDYYDPMYRYQLEQKKEYILFQGDRHAILEWAVHRKTFVV